MTVYFEISLCSHLWVNFYSPISKLSNVLHLHLCYNIHFPKILIFFQIRNLNDVRILYSLSLESIIFSTLFPIAFASISQLLYHLRHLSVTTLDLWTSAWSSPSPVDPSISLYSRQLAGFYSSNKIKLYFSIFRWLWNLSLLANFVFLCPSQISALLSYAKPNLFCQFLFFFPRLWWKSDGLPSPMNS